MTTEPVVPPNVEEISSKVHKQWMESKRAQGVESRKSESGEELMVPYEQLSEAAKDLDRGSVRAVLSAIAAMTDRVVPPTKPEPQNCPTCGSDKLEERLPVNYDSIFDYDCRDKWHGAEAVAPPVSTAPPQTGFDEATEKRWQDAIYELCKKEVGIDADFLIDGGGTDSGDALDFTLTEIGQAIGFWREKAAAQPIESTGTDTPTKCRSCSKPITDNSWALVSFAPTNSTETLRYCRDCWVVMFCSLIHATPPQPSGPAGFVCQQTSTAAPLRPSAPGETTETDLSKAAALEIWRVPQHYASWLESTAEIVRQVAQSSREALLREIAQELRSDAKEHNELGDEDAEFKNVHHVLATELRKSAEKLLTKYRVKDNSNK